MPTSTTYPTTTTLHTGGDGFIQALRQDLAKATQSIVVQVMSFEADHAGQQVIELLSSYPQLQRRLLVDAYSTVVVNDTWLAKPFGSTRCKIAREEALQLWPLLQYAKANGIDIRFSQPLGFLFLKYPFRNHKKSVLIDQNISYVGGINITDHNFGWNDLMIRQQDEQLASALQDSFEVDWQAGFLPKRLHSSNPTTTTNPSTRDTSTKQAHPPAYQQIDPNTELYLLDGLATRAAYRRLQTQVEQAQKVEVFSPYITYPMLDSVARVIEHTVWMPEHNNKALVQLTSRLPRYRKLNIQTIPGSPEEMLHAKVMILDGETVIYGSSNFDLISYLFEQELVIVRRDVGLAQKIQTALRP